MPTGVGNIGQGWPGMECPTKIRSEACEWIIVAAMEPTLWVPRLSLYDKTVMFT